MDEVQERCEGRHRQSGICRRTPIDILIGPFSFKDKHARAQKIPLDVFGVGFHLGSASTNRASGKPSQHPNQAESRLARFESPALSRSVIHVK